MTRRSEAEANRRGETARRERELAVDYLHQGEGQQ